ncbi:MAG TPA: hypothetical protein VG106_10315, partial [Vicinamibacterales bacterium]|nr:hypothetical protein [Vicinamibacterales bacterium]
LLAIELFQRTLFTRDGILLRLRMLRAAAEVWLLVQWLKYFSSAAGPGTTMADLHVQRDNIALLANRICLDLSALPSGAWKLVTEHWPILFGTRVQPLVDFAIESPLSQGLPGTSVLLAAALILAAAAVLVHLLRERRWRREYDFCAYLVLVGLFSAAGYVLGRCGQLMVVVIRYELLSVLGAAGLGAWFMATSPSRVALRTWTALACALIAVGALAHGRLLTEYVRDAPAGTKRMIARHLEASGIRYATSDYWLAYALTFLTNERVIVASEDLVRIQEYHRIISEHREDAVRVLRRPCVGGRMVIRGVYFCPPS